METVAEALASLGSGSTVECARALAYARDVAPQDETLWQAAMEYFEEKAPPELWGYFGFWLSRTMAQLTELMGETRFRNLRDWTASQADLWLELVRGWNEQPALLISLRLLS